MWGLYQRYLTSLRNDDPSFEEPPLSVFQCIADEVWRGAVDADNLLGTIRDSLEAFRGARPQTLPPERNLPRL